MTRYIACRAVAARDLFGGPLVDGLEILGVLHAANLYPAAALLCARIDPDVGVMPWDAATVSQQRAARKVEL